MIGNTKSRIGINCDLYAVFNLDNKLKENKIHNAKIIRKNLFISQVQDGLNTDSEFYNEFCFNYSYNIPFIKRISIKNGKEKYINTMISYNGSNNKDYNQICYTYLTPWQKLKNSFNFNRLWIQQSSNIMWIINILIALLAAIAAIITA